MTTYLRDFQGPNCFLSNFQEVVVTLDGASYPTTEHAYQAAKTLNLAERKEIEISPTPGKAKRLGQRVDMRSDWDAVKAAIMWDLTVQKFDLHTNPRLAQKLLETGTRLLVEGNTWHDNYWGVCHCGGTPERPQCLRGAPGQNWLGRLLTLRRSQLLLQA